MPEEEKSHYKAECTESVPCCHGNIDYNTQGAKLSVHVVVSFANHSSTTQLLFFSNTVL